MYHSGPAQPAVPAGGYNAASNEDAGAMEILSMGLDSLLMTGPSTTGPASLGSSTGPSSSGLDDLLGGGFGGSTTGPASLGSSGIAPLGMGMGSSTTPAPAASGGSGLDDLFSLGTSVAPAGFNFYSPPKQEWLDAAKNKVFRINRLKL